MPVEVLLVAAPPEIPKGEIRPAPLEIVAVTPEPPAFTAEPPVFTPEPPAFTPEPPSVSAASLVLAEGEEICPLAAAARERALA